MSLLVGAIAGAIGLSLATVLYHWLLFRPALADGQYGMALMFTLPAGCVLGAATGYAHSIATTTSTFAGIMCLCACIVVGVPVALYVWMTTTNTAPPGSASSKLAESLLFAAPTLVWLVWLVVRGLSCLDGKAYMRPRSRLWSYHPLKSARE